MHATHSRKMLRRRCYARHQKAFFYRRPIVGVCTFLFLAAATLVCQLYLATTHFTSMDKVYLPDGDPTYRQTSTPSKKAKNLTQAAFGACIMVKEDNDLLYEWIAYHYTVLPLGYLVIGSDLANSQDPAYVLNRWTKAGVYDLRHWILTPEAFIHRHGNYDEKYGRNTTTKDGAELTSAELRSHYHHALIHRQKGFLTACTELLKKHGVGWSVFIDSDEFVLLNPLTPEDELLEVDGKSHLSISKRSYEIRQSFLEYAGNQTFLDIVLDLQRKNDIMECYTMPRLLVGALENRTCPNEDGVQSVQQLAHVHMSDRFQHMSTLRFVQHAKKGDFSRSKYGKVMMDISKIPDQTIEFKQPRNIHRPYDDHCGSAGGAHFPNSLFFLFHYIGSWDRYASRDDRRRDRFEWKKRALVDEGTTSTGCAVQNWYPRFFARVGEGRAIFLLGGKQNKNSLTLKPSTF